MKNVWKLLPLLATTLFLFCTDPTGSTVPEPVPPKSELAQPLVTGIAITNNQQPTWDWTLPDNSTSERYRLDGGNWIEDVGLATLSFTPADPLSEGAHTLEVQAQDKAGVWSASGWLATTIDITTPLAPEVSGPEITNITRPTWSWSSPEANASYRYQLVELEPLADWDSLEETSQAEFTPADSLDYTTYTLHVVVRDQAGNWSNPNQHSIKIDAGFFTPYVQGDSPTMQTTPTWTWTIPEGAIAIRYRLDSAAWQETSTAVTSFTPETDLPEGSHTLEVQAQDTDHNWSATGSRLIMIDLTAPVAPRVSGDSPTRDTTPTWSWNTPEDTISFHYRLDNKKWVEVTGTTTLSFTPDSPLSQGMHTLEVLALDAAGNKSIAGKKAITIDLTPPVAPFVSGSSPTNDTTPTWSWNVPGDTENFQYRLDSGAWVLLSGTAITDFTPIVALAAGIHTLEVQAQDNVGNWSVSGSRTIDINLTSPASPLVSGRTPINNPRPHWTWTIPTNSSDILYNSVNLRYRLNGSEWSYTEGTTVTSFQPAQDLAEGSHLLEVQAANVLDNWSPSGSRTIVVDLTAPLSPTISSDSPTNDTTPTWSWTIPGDAVNIRYALDGATWTTVGNISTNSFTPNTALSEGDHTLDVQAQDAAGNWSGSITNHIFINLSILPAPLVEVATLTNNPTPTWRWTKPAETAEMRYRLNGAAWIVLDATAPALFTPTMALSEGDHTLEVQVRGSVGSWSESGSAATTIDFTPPLSPRISGISPTADATPTWSWTLPADAESVRYRMDSSDWIVAAKTTSSYTPASSLSQGEHTLEVQAADQAGNWSLSGSHTISVDATLLAPPQISGTSPSFDRTPSWTWTIPGGAEDIRYRLDGAAWTYSGGTGTTSYTPPAPLSYGNHTLEVQAQNSLGNWSPSGSRTILIHIETPGNVTASQGTDRDRISLNWDPVPDVDGYEIFRSEAASTGYTKLGATVSQSYSDQLVNYGIAYYYQIRAFSAASEFSDFSLPATGYTTVYVPLNVKASGGTYIDRIDVTWDVQPDHTYHLERATLAAGPYTACGTASTSPCSDTTVTDNATYYYRIKAETSGGALGEYSAVASGYRNILAAPAIMIASDGDFEDRVALSWDSVAGAERYYVYRATALDGVYSEITMLTDNTYFEDTTAVHGITYYYKVRAWSAATLYGSYSNIDQGSLAAVIPTTPMGVTATTGIYTDRVEIIWDASAKASEYIVYRFTTEDGVYQELTTTTDLIYKDYAVTSGTTYFYYIEAKSASGGVSGPSITVRGYTS